METRGTRYYVGAKLDDAHKAVAIRDILKTHGWHQTYDWTDYMEREKDASATTYALAASAEIDGVREAQVSIFILPGGRGCWAEIGAALAGRGQVYIVGDPYDGGKEPPVFYFHPAVNRIHLSKSEPAFDPEKICKRVLSDREGRLYATPHEAE